MKKLGTDGRLRRTLGSNAGLYFPAVKGSMLVILGLERDSLPLWAMLERAAEEDDVS